MCVQCYRKTTTTVTDKTLPSERSGRIFKNLRKISATIAKNLAASVSKNPGRAKNGAEIGTATLSRISKVALSTTSVAVYHSEKGL